MGLLLAGVGATVGAAGPARNPQIHSFCHEKTLALRPRPEIGHTDQNGAESRRTLRPLGLWFWGKVWTLVAWCELRDDFRMFRIDRIGALTPGARFRPESGRALADFLRRMERDRTC